MADQTAAGQRNRRLVIESKGSGQGTYGEPTGTWSTLATVWAHIKPLQGRELQAAQQMAPEVTHRIAIPYSAALADPVAMAKCRATYGGRIFNIHAVMNQDERNRELIILASEGLNPG